ncbi:hypothetical protein C8R46DRAFT_41043 [Mycena filopes]|nr:hypothetical protein C8R46DRAFT_41043 [Mycena filopes]
MNGKRAKKGLGTQSESPRSSPTPIEPRERSTSLALTEPVEEPLAVVSRLEEPVAFRLDEAGIVKVTSSEEGRGEASNLTATIPSVERLLRLEPTKSLTQLNFQSTATDKLLTQMPRPPTPKWDGTLDKPPLKLEWTPPSKSPPISDQNLIDKFFDTSEDSSLHADAPLEEAPRARFDLAPEDGIEQSASPILLIAGTGVASSPLARSEPGIDESSDTAESSSLHREAPFERTTSRTPSRSNKKRKRTPDSDAAHVDWDADDRPTKSRKRRQTMTSPSTEIGVLPTQDMESDRNHRHEVEVKNNRRVSNPSPNSSVSSRRGGSIHWRSTPDPKLAGPSKSPRRSARHFSPTPSPDPSLVRASGSSLASNPGYIDEPALDIPFNSEGELRTRTSHPMGMGVYSSQHTETDQWHHEVANPPKRKIAQRKRKNHPESDSEAGEYRKTSTPKRAKSESHPCPLALEKNCEKTFTRFADAVRHGKTVHNDTVDNTEFQCSDGHAAQSFSRQDALTRHRRIFHNEPDSSSTPRKSSKRTGGKRMKSSRRKGKQKGPPEGED